MARPARDGPTDGELEILNVLWDAGPSGLGSVHEALNAQRAVALTTVATMLGTMLAKGLVERHHGARGYLWSAKVSREAAASGLVKRLLGGVFGGSAGRLVAHLIEGGQLDEKERRQVLELLNEADADPKPRKKGGRR